MTTNKEELLLFFKQMYTMRRMEITNDTEYKVCHFLSAFEAPLQFNVLIVSHRLETFVDSATCMMVRRPSPPVCMRR